MEAREEAGISHEIRDKHQRILKGETPSVFDLFAGCGGMTLGFRRAGFKPLAGIEYDKDATRSYAYNHHGADDGLHSIPHDITAAGEDPAAWVQEKFGVSSDRVDVLVGGPPCPTFTRIGRAKINSRSGMRESSTIQHRLFGGTEVQNRFAYSPLAYLEEARNELYHDYLSFVKALKPVAVLMENVPEFLNQPDPDHPDANEGRVDHGRVVARYLEKLGYESCYTILNAARYGVPQWRERFFLVAVHKEAGGLKNWEFPEPTHGGQIPAGVLLNRSIALNRQDGSGQYHRLQATLQFSASESPEPDDHGRHFRPPPTGGPELPQFVSAEEALSDLPEYREHTKTPLPLRNGWMRSSAPANYSHPPKSEYAQMMREWKPGPFAGPGFPAHQHIARHTMVGTKRDVRIFRRMKEGDDYRDASVIARYLFSRVRARLTKSREAEGKPPLSEEKWKELEGNYIPPYPVDQFPQKWWKLNRDQPCRTLTAHLGADTYSHIHYDKSQARMITVQEAARLQSFPDGFVFQCSMNSAYRQIGNSVPPLLAFALASQIMNHLKGTEGGP